MSQAGIEFLFSRAVRIMVTPQQIQFGPDSILVMSAGWRQETTLARQQFRKVN